jgi:hypothetical protein
MKFYVFSVSGWEEYSPIWLASEKSARQFKDSVRLAIRNIWKAVKAEKYDGFIDGHTFLDRIAKELAPMGFNVVQVEAKIDIGGSCLYDKRHKYEPPIKIPRDVWKEILEHNIEVRKDLYKDRKKRKNGRNTKARRA